MHITPPLIAALATATASFATAQSTAQPTPQPRFRIRVVDAQTERGIPLVELTTVNRIVYVTDSAGVAAVDEPGLFGERVWFHVASHGYELPADGFGYRGFRAVLEPGGSTTVRMNRINVAERLYRVTGQGIYRDSALLGDPLPIREPVSNGGVFGQDSVVNAVYRGRLRWFWGDTSRASYPLGNFATSGAVSRLPGDGGLDPAVGVDLEYFVDRSGFCRAMCPIEGPGPVWIGGLMVIEHQGQQRLVCHYSRMKNLGTRLEHGIAIWNDDAEVFDKLRELPLDAPLHPSGHPVRTDIDGEPWFYFPAPYPAVRVRASLDEIVDPSRYEAFTCLRQGARWDAKAPAVERDADGALAWAWKRDTAVVSPGRWNGLVRSGAVEAGEGWMNLTDVETGDGILGHAGSVCWNAHRRKWVMIANQSGGRSMLGEIWYAEADALPGDWGYARRIVTHDAYSFYNVKQHPYFDQQDGRLVYFEGTYTAMFSGSPRKTPRYDYNQIMYRLDLDDPRLALPGRAYRLERDGIATWRIGAFDGAEAAPFCAVPSDREQPGTLPVFATTTELPGGARTTRLSVGPTAGGRIAFRALAPEAVTGEPTNAALIAVREWTHGPSGRLDYRIDGDPPRNGVWTVAPEPAFRAWRAPAGR